ncbi:hypothetical protein Tco_0298615 [Tanacetum coccineum]
MSADVARGHGGDGGSDDRPPPYQAPTGCGGCLGNRGKGTRKPNLGGRRAGRLHTRQETRNLGLKAITDKNGPVPIRFEFGDKETLMPLGEHAAHWANYLGELVRELPLYYPSWRQMPPERKAGVVEKIGSDLRPTWMPIASSTIYAGIPAAFAKDLTMASGALKVRHIGALTRTGLTTWSKSDSDVPHTFPRQIGMHKVCVLEMIPRHRYRVSNINKTGKGKVVLTTGIPVIAASKNDEETS